MKIQKYFIAISLIILISGCKKNVITVFNKENPFSLIIKKERSYYQALKISDRLNDMNKNAYVVYQVDTNQGEWFMVLSGAKATEDSIIPYQTRIQNELKLDSLQIVNYNTLDSFKIVMPGDTSVIKEVEKIAANQPDVPNNLIEVCKKYPQSNALYLDQITLINLQDKQKKKSLLISENLRMDLPRGISLKKLSKNVVVSTGPAHFICPSPKTMFFIVVYVFGCFSKVF